MESTRVQIVVRHISGARATEIDIVPLGAHRELILGRAPSAAIRFDPRRDVEVGRLHARIEPTDDPLVFRLADLDSVNGTFLNGVRISGAATLRSGDRVRLGADGPEVELGFETLPSPAGAGRTRAG